MVSLPTSKKIWYGLSLTNHDVIYRYRKRGFLLKTRDKEFARTPEIRLAENSPIEERYTTRADARAYEENDEKGPKYKRIRRG